MVPPLVVVTTEEWMQIVLFPFRKGERLVNGILLPKIDLWKAGPEIDEKVLWLLRLFVCPDHYVEDLTLPKEGSSAKKKTKSKNTHRGRKSNTESDDPTSRDRTLKKEIKVVET